MPRWNGLTKTNANGRVIKRGYIIREDNQEIISFQFNPTEWNDPKKAVYSFIESPGSPYPDVNYIRGDIESIKLSLIFDEIFNGKVDGYNKTCEQKLSQFFGLLEPSSQMVVVRGTKVFSAPTFCKFCWGNIVRRIAVTELNVKRTRFDKNLNTVSATVDIEFVVVR